MKKIISFLLTISTAFSFIIFNGCSKKESTVSTPLESSSQTTPFENSSSSTNSVAKKITTFYDTAKTSKILLDIVAEDVYSYWYDAIYKDAYQNDIDIAINTALADNSDTINDIKNNDTLIQSLYKEIRDSELSTEIKAVMSIYLDYYEFAINVSGSFQEYKESIDPLQKQFEDSLKALYLEL